MLAHRHARSRLLERYGLELDDDQWEAIVQNTRDDLYERAESAITNAGHFVALVPMGDPKGVVYFVPMVVNMGHGYVLTVLPPGAA
jgi:hypothetical protein